MARDERDFLQILEERAREEKRVVRSGILPNWAAVFGEWLGVNPWRTLIPSSVFLYLCLRLALGDVIREIVLAIFGGFRW